MSIDPEAYLGPFHRTLDLKIADVTSDSATVEVQLTRKHSSMDEKMIAQGGVVFTLADFCGGLTLMATDDSIVASPTVDMRIDYLKPATSDLTATGGVVRTGEYTGVADVEVYDESSERVAQARGVYKLQREGTTSLWTPE
jgi:uncharacterized protein (TIGR00369 family)